MCSSDLSAGAICWFRHGLTDSTAGEVRAIACLGFLPGSCAPHYDSEPERRPAMHRLVGDGSIPAGLALDDGAALHFVGTQPLRAVSSRPDARVYRVRRGARGAVETPLATRYLGR